VLEADEVQDAARTLGLEITPLEIRRTEDIAPAFETLKSQTDALYVVTDALMAARSDTHHNVCAQRAVADDL
jgi:ABC-type uncharacterized transport system substrate-binding protein